MYGTDDRVSIHFALQGANDLAALLSLLSLAILNGLSSHVSAIHIDSRQYNVFTR